MNASHGWNHAWTISLADHITAQPDGVADLVLIGPTGRTKVGGMRPSVRDALVQLSPPGAVLSSMLEPLAELGPSGELAEFWYSLRKWLFQGVLRLAVTSGGQRLATLTPTATTFSFLPEWPLVERLQLSRFALVHRPFHELVAESPLVPARIALDDARAAQLLLALEQPLTVSELAALVPSLPAEVIGPLVHLFATAGVLTTVSAAGESAEQRDSRLATWEFSDLLFHTRSRRGRYDNPLGALFLHAGTGDPPPPLKPVAPDAQWIVLPKPDPSALAQRSSPLSEVLERRASIREYGQRPPTIDQLGEFCYRVARVKSQERVAYDTHQGRIELDFASRPYPGGGNLHEIEFYFVVQACEGLAQGLYRYEPLEHRLQVISGPTTETHRLLVDASLSSETARESLQILVILATRFPRIAWKYSGVAYALTLKHVGVAMQTMYLVATDMGLAPCSLGAGDADLFARAAGNDYYLETSVGEFLLGSVGPRSPSGS